jgi:phosphoribosylglycinamide formyltransferase-1
MVGRMSARLVVLVSGAGTNLQALIDACADPYYGATVAAVGADRPGIEGLARAERAGIPTFIARVAGHPNRGAWDRALSESVAAFDPDHVV